MMRTSIRVCGIALAALLVLPAISSAQDLKLTLDGGRATLVAHNVSLRQILAEWERVGQTKIPNRDRMPESLVTLNLVDVPEASALSTLLRSGSGYMAVARTTPIPNTSNFRAVLLMAAAPKPAAGLPQSSRGDQSPQFQPNNPRFQVPGGPPSNQGMQGAGRGANPMGIDDPDAQDDEPLNAPPPQQNQGPFQMRVVGPNGQIINLPAGDGRTPRVDPADAQQGGAQQTTSPPLVPTFPGAATRPGQVVPVPPKPPGGGGPGAPTRPPG